MRIRDFVSRAAPPAPMNQKEADVSEEEKSGSSVKSLQVALDILEAVAGSREDVGISELTQQLGLTKGSVFRYMKTLTERGYLSQNPTTARYGLGMRLHIMGKLASDRIDLLSVSEPIMADLRDKLNLTVNLAGRGRNSVTVLRSLIGNQVMEIGIRVGAELPYNATSQGRVIMAFAKQDMLAQLKRQKLHGHTEHSLTDFAELSARVEKARQQGWAGAAQETVLGINAVSVPLLAANGDCVAALTLVGSMQHLHDNPAQEQLAALRGAGHAISQALGYRGIYPGTV